MAAAIVDNLGAHSFYGVPASTISPVWDAVCGRDDLELHLAATELAGGYAANMQSQLSGAPVGMLCGSGPGVLGVVSALAGANTCGVGTVTLVGEIPTSGFGRGYLQDGSAMGLHVIQLLEPICGYVARIDDPERAPEIVARARSCATMGRRRPAVIVLPLNIGLAPAPTDWRPSLDHRERQPRPDLREQIDRVAGFLHVDAKVHIQIGAGCRSAIARSRVATLAQRLDATVSCTPRGKGLLDEHDPRHVGVLGHAGHASAKSAWAAADVLLILGCGVTETSTNRASLRTSSAVKCVRVDIEPDRCPERFDELVIGDVSEVLAALLTRVPPRRRRSEGGQGRSPVLRSASVNSQRLDPGSCVEALQALAPSDTIYLSDIGDHMLFGVHHLRIPETGDFMLDNGLGGMTSGVHGALGAKLAEPRRPVVAIVGDFGMHMGIQVLSSCVAAKAGVVFAVFNNRSMSMVEHGHRRAFGRSPQMAELDWDLPKVAEGLGAYVQRIALPEDFGELPDDLFVRDRPTVLIMEVDDRRPPSAASRDQQFSDSGNGGGR